MKIYIKASKSNNPFYDMDCEKITNSSIKKYKNQYKQLSHVRVNSNTEGYLYIIDGKVQAMINTEDKNGDIWIQGLEIFGESKGKGYSKYLLDIAVNDLEATYLSVNKNNMIAKKIYDKYGFEVYDEDNNMYYMKI
jgi:ribosomal protein S18 acetylase RimI-like enzyme